MNNRGQALIEMAVLVLSIAGLIGAFLTFTHTFLIRQKLLVAGREAMLLYSSGRFEKSEVRDRIQQYLETGTPRLPRADTHVTIDDLRDTLEDRLIGIDRITITYKNMEETCFIKHANTYGPSLPPLWGPPIR